MKLAMHYAMWGAAMAAVVYVAVGEGAGALYNNPLACIGVALIGLGLCKHAAQQQQAEPASDA